jgi:hypothetical protein
VKASLAVLPEFELLRDVYRIPGRDEGDGFFAATIVRQP